LSHIEGLGDKFRIESFLLAQEKTKACVLEISSKVFLGMTEEQGHELIDKVLEKSGASGKWHPHKFRIGTNTTKAFREISEPTTLKENDIFFIDIGPVFDEHEGDYGQTFVFGENEKYSKIIKACDEVFRSSANICKSEKLSGIDLYKYAQDKAQQLGYELNLKMNGHRLGDFPHALFFKGSLGDVDICPSENRWVLEILIRHPKEEFGAFFEDLI
jgi:Xaa-Pro aminopeptidase